MGSSPGRLAPSVRPPRGHPLDAFAGLESAGRGLEGCGQGLELDGETLRGKVGESACGGLRGLRVIGRHRGVEIGQHLVARHQVGHRLRQRLLARGKRADQGRQQTARGRAERLDGAAELLEVHPRLVAGPLADGQVEQPTALGRAELEHVGDLLAARARRRLRVAVHELADVALGHADLASQLGVEHAARAAQRVEIVAEKFHWRHLPYEREGTGNGLTPVW